MNNFINNELEISSDHFDDSDESYGENKQRLITESINQRKGISLSKKCFIMQQTKVF